MFFEQLVEPGSGQPRAGAGLRHVVTADFDELKQVVSLHLMDDCFPDFTEGREISVAGHPHGRERLIGEGQGLGSFVRGRAEGVFGRANADVHGQVLAVEGSV